MHLPVYVSELHPYHTLYPEMSCAALLAKYLSVPIARGRHNRHRYRYLTSRLPEAIKNNQARTTRSNKFIRNALTSAPSMTCTTEASIAWKAATAILFSYMKSILVSSNKKAENSYAYIGCILIKYGENKPDESRVEILELPLRPNI